MATITAPLPTTADPTTYLGMAPLKMRILSAQGLGERKAALHLRPDGRTVESGGDFTIEQGDDESALKGRDVLLQFVVEAGGIFVREGVLKFFGLGDGLGFRGGVESGVVEEQRGHGGSIGADLFDGLREPLVDGAVHEPVGEPEHGNHGQE